MGVLPRPDVAPGPRRELVDALHALHHQAGWPSLRRLAADTGVSHTTVSKALSAPTLPSWGTVELLAEAMGGDVELFHDLWLSASAPADAPLPTVARIAGRSAELAVVRRHLETGTGLLVVTGEAGMGKTRLVSAATESVDTFVAIGHCLPLSTEVPLMPVADLLRSIYESDGGQWLTQALADCPPYVIGSLSRLLPDIADESTLTDPDDDWSRHRLFSAISGALEALAADRPIAVVMEDLHWADPMTLDVLEHLAARGCGWPMLGTWRIEPETRPVAAEWWNRARRSTRATVLPLGPLSHEETGDQLRLLTGSVDPETVDRIHARSLGQPLFTEQLAAHGPVSETELPDLLADFLDRRFEHLPPSAWVIARILGVADRGLSVDVLTACVDLDTDGLAAALTELDSRMLLASLRADVVQLRHPLLAAAARHRLVAVESSEVHRILAEALGNHDAAAAEVAAHWQAAGDHAEELAWQVKAARTADERFAGAEAAQHWMRVLDLWPAGETSIGSPPITRAQVLWAAMDGVDMSGRPTDGRALAQRALAEAADWPEADRAETLRRSANYADTLHHVGAGKDLTTEALSIYRRLPPSEGLVRALAHHAFVLNQFGRTDEAAEVLDEARLAIERLGPSPLMRGHLALMADQEARGGRLNEARAWISEIAHVETDIPEPLRDIWIDVNHTDILLLACAGADEVAAAGRRGLDAAATWGVDTMELNVLRYNVAAAWARAGRIGRAAELVDPFTDAAFSPHFWLLYVMRAALDGVRGRSDEARSRLAVLSQRDGIDIGLLETERAAFELWHGEPDEALRAISGACEVGTGATVPGDTGVPLVLAARAAADLACSSRAGGQLRRDLRTRVDALREASGHDPFSKQALPSDRCAAAQWTAELARLDGTDTLDHWTHAATSWDRSVRPHDAAYCRWRGAQVALREGQGTLAARLLARAAADAREHVPLSHAIADAVTRAR